MTKTSGYSGTPLAKKLGLKPDFTVHLINPVKEYWDLFENIPEGIEEVDQPFEASVDFVHLFCTSMENLLLEATKGKAILKKTGLLWVSWPKGSSKIPTDINRDIIRTHVLGIGLVDVKVAAINEDWSGLKFVYRTKDR